MCVYIYTNIRYIKCKYTAKKRAAIYICIIHIHPWFFVGPSIAIAQKPSFCNSLQHVDPATLRCQRSTGGDLGGDVVCMYMLSYLIS